MLPFCAESLSSSLLSKNVKVKIYRMILIVVCIVVRLRAFENRMPRRIFRSKRDEVTGEWRRLQKKELYALYPSLHTISVIKPKKKKWAGHVACTERGEMIQGFGGEA